MPRTIVTCWDEHRWLAAVAQVRGRSFTIERWLDGPMIDQGTSLRGAFESAKLMGEDAWVAIGRGRVELRTQRFPPLPEAEIPAVVRMQALQQASSDRLLCDYLPVQSDDRGAEVLVATAGGELSDAVTKMVAPTIVQRLALRPLCSAAWLAHLQRGEPLPTMLIDPRRDEVDFVIFRDRHPAFVRTVRLPDDPKGAAEVIASEARRSLITGGVADARTGTEPRIVIWGDARSTDVLLPAIQRAFGQQVRSLAPIPGGAGYPAPPASADASSLAAILGLLHAGSAEPQLLIDLIQPRKPPDPPNLARRYSIIGGAAAAVCLLVGSLAYQRVRVLRAEASDLSSESRSLNEDVEKAKRNQADLALIDRFNNGNVQWMEQLALYAQAAPGADKMRLKSIQGQASLAAGGRAAGAGGTLTFNGTVIDPDLLDGLEAKLREQKLTVTRGKVNEEKDQSAGYHWSFTEIVQAPSRSAAAAKVEAKPAATPEPKMEPESKPEVPASVKTTPESKPEVPPEAKTPAESKPEATPEVKTPAESKPVVPPEVKTPAEANPADAVKPTLQPATEPATSAPAATPAPAQAASPTTATAPTPAPSPTTAPAPAPAEPTTTTNASKPEATP